MQHRLWIKFCSIFLDLYRPAFYFCKIRNQPRIENIYYLVNALNTAFGSFSITLRKLRAVAVGSLLCCSHS
jgi:hypothetical protein